MEKLRATQVRCVQIGMQWDVEILTTGQSGLSTWSNYSSGLTMDEALKLRNKLIK